MYQVGSYEKSRQTDEVKSKLNQEIAKLDEKMKRLTRMRLDDEISKADYLEYKLYYIEIKLGIEIDT